MLKVAFSVETGVDRECLYAAGRDNHPHSLFALKDDDAPSKADPTDYIEGVCPEILNRMFERAMISKSAVKPENLNGLPALVVREAVKNTQYIRESRYEDYVKGFGTFLDELGRSYGWSKEETRVQQFAEKDDLMVVWNVSNGVKATAVHAIFGSVPHDRLSETERGSGIAYFANRLHVWPAMDETPVQKMNALEAQTKFVYRVKVFREH